MKGQTHILFGALIGGLYFQHFGGGDLFIKFLFTGALILGALLPDIDNEHSTISHKMPKLSKTITLFFKHRGFLHSIWIPLLILAFVKLFLVRYLGLPDLIVMGFIVGYLSHLASDMLTVKGIKPFHPFAQKLHIKGFVTTGTIIESIIGIAIIMYLIIL